MKTKLLIFGITGDLSTRKLLPALQAITAQPDYQNLEIIGVSRKEVDVARLINDATGSNELTQKTSVFSMDLASHSDYARLKQYINLAGDEQLLIYFSVPPMIATSIADLLGEAGFAEDNVKLLFEKPFGVDYTSAVDMIERTTRYFNESQIYRIDHYLAKEMAQNITMFRASNALFSHVWDNRSIEKIEVIASERLTIEGRAQFYEQTGALRDVVQGHLMQLLSLVTMQIPPQVDWEIVSQLRQQAIEALKPASPTEATRAQYGGYQEEAGNSGSTTETFVSLTLHSTDPLWEGVPFVLTTGKALNEKTTEIRIRFRKSHDAQGNLLVLRIQPNEGVEMEFYTKKPGYDRELEKQKLLFDYKENNTLPDAYEQVLVDAIRSQKSLFTSSSEVLASWRVIQPILTAWEMDNMPLRIYPVGSSTHTICSVQEKK